jgi:uncharacterized membrane protein YsdA (DUF1294 family)
LSRGTPNDDGIVFVVAVAVTAVVVVVAVVIFVIVVDDGHVRRQPAWRIRRNDVVQLRGGGGEEVR